MFIVQEDDVIFSENIIMYFYTYLVILFAKLYKWKVTIQLEKTVVANTENTLRLVTLTQLIRCRN